jgi:alpha-L-rhamnosidase
MTASAPLEERRQILPYAGIVLALFLNFSHTALRGQDPFAQTRAAWLQKAKATTPALTEVTKRPVRIVSIVSDTASFQHWKAVSPKAADSLYQGSFKKKSGIILDFGEHLTGYLSFAIEDLRGVLDAPLRFRFTFAETPAEAVMPFDPYDGALSRAWLQDEMITVAEAPKTYRIPRRVAFRYVRIDLLGSSRFNDFRISDVSVVATTSVKTMPAPLGSGTSKQIAAIDRVGLATLKECMQTVYEDGPKRDRRLWIGDLYLEAQANTYSFKNHDLTKHCLYLLAALSNEKGFLNGNVFERPEPHPQPNVLFDYALLYNVALKDYLDASGDRETAVDLWPLAKRQLDIPKMYLLPDGSLDYARASKEWWVFIDWRDGLDKEASLYGVVIFGLKNTYALARQLGKESEVKDVPALIESLTRVARKKLYDKKLQLFVSGSERQVSYASQAWMTLSGVATAAEAKAAFTRLPTTANAVRPGAPYLYHYVIEAMIQCGLKSEAKALLTNYWGGMIDQGADTFWEVYDPKNDFLSPYNSYLVNSYCHAWSCTPVYFIRKYKDLFQN